MLDEGVELCLETRQSGFAVEGFVVTEEGEQLVGLEPVQPFIG